MLQLPNELLSRVADFARDEDLLSLRLTCKLLESITYKHFIAAFMTNIHFSASLAGIQRLEEKVAHPKFGSSIKTIMASVTEDQLLQQEECRAPLRDILAKVSHLEPDLQLGVSCCPIFDRTCGTAIRAVKFARLMFNAKPSESPDERFIIDLRRLPPDENDRALQNHLGFLSGAVYHPSASFMRSNVDILLPNRGRVIGRSRNPRWTLISSGTCIEFNDLEHGCHLEWATILGPINPTISRVQITNCKLSVRTMRFLLTDIKSSCWHLELKNCHFDDTPPCSNSSSLILRDALCREAGGLNSCFLSNLTSQSGPILADDFEASSPYEIRKRMSTIRFLEQADVGKEAN